MLHYGDTAFLCPSTQTGNPYWFPEQLQAALPAPPSGIVYTETIVNLYPEELWDSLQELSEECEKIDPDSHFRKAFDSVIEKVYREGFKDGLALSAWLENGTPDHRL